MTESESWIELEVPISQIKGLLKTHDVLISSADGYVPVSAFVDKGEWEEYVLEIDGKTIRCNESHLFETSIGWLSSRDILTQYEEGYSVSILMDSGEYQKLTSISNTGNIIPIVDIQVDHPNHRYYADGVSSHNTNVGKSLFLCSNAADNIRQGFNVLYITLEMSEEKIGERIDCNLLDVSLDDLYRMRKEDFTSRLSSIQNKSHGKLVIREFPTGGAHVGHFKSLMDELKQKKNFIPDIVYIDYVNICASLKYSGGSNWNSYTAVKAITEELRGMAVEYNVAIMSATQFNRSGMSNSDAEMTDISESVGLAFTADFVAAIIRSEELDNLGQLMVKQLKSRFGSTSYYKRFIIGIQLDKFKLYNIDNPTEDIADSGNQSKDDQPLFDSNRRSGYNTNDLKFD
jgi:hypothetical protein